MNFEPTRITPNTLIDLIFSNKPQFIHGLINEPCSFSDHNLLVFNYKKPRNPIYKNNSLSIFDKSIIHSYKNDVDQLISNCFDHGQIINPNDSLDFFTDGLTSVYNRHTKIIHRPLINNNQPWYSPFIQQVSLIRDKYYKIAKRHNFDTFHTNIYRKLRNQCYILCINAKKKPFFTKKLP